MVTIRLARHGTKKLPFYRVVVTEARRPRDGRFIENIGTFDPAGKLALDAARLEYWKKQGAKPSHTLDRLLKAQARQAAAPQS
jgi:small subunit ribosomal protein S16